MSAANRNGDEIGIRKALWSTANRNEDGTGIRKARMSTADRMRMGSGIQIMHLYPIPYKHIQQRL